MSRLQLSGLGWITWIFRKAAASFAVQSASRPEKHDDDGQLLNGGDVSHQPHLCPSAPPCRPSMGPCLFRRSVGVCFPRPQRLGVEAGWLGMRRVLLKQPLLKLLLL